MLQAPAIQLPKENISVFTQRARKHYLFFMCVLNVFNFTNLKLHLLQRNCSWLPQYSCNIKLFCFMSLALLIQLHQTEKSENLIKTEFLRDSASSFHWLESSIFSCLFVLSPLVTSPLISWPSHVMPERGKGPDPEEDQFQSQGWEKEKSNQMFPEFLSNFLSVKSILVPCKVKKGKKTRRSIFAPTAWWNMLWERA